MHMNFEDLAKKYKAAISLTNREQANNIIRNLVKDGACNMPKDRDEDLTWFKKALKDREIRWFAVQILEKVNPLPSSLFNDLVTEALLEPNPSANRRFIEPCIKRFGVELVKSKIAELSTTPGVVENDGVKKIMYWVR